MNHSKKKQVILAATLASTILLGGVYGQTTVAATTDPQVSATIQNIEELKQQKAESLTIVRAHGKNSQDDVNSQNSKNSITEKVKIFIEKLTSTQSVEEVKQLEKETIDAINTIVQTEKEQTSLNLETKHELIEKEQASLNLETKHELTKKEQQDRQKVEKKRIR